MTRHAQRQRVGRREEHGDQRHTGPQLAERDATAPDQGYVGSPAQPTRHPTRSSRIAAITSAIPAKVTRLEISARQPARTAPPSQKASAETATAVTATSPQTGCPQARICSRSQVSGQTRIERIAPIRT